MRAAEIQPGVVYAYRNSSGLYPIAFLAPVDDAHLYRSADRFRGAGTPAFEPAPGSKPRRGTAFASTRGYPAAFSYHRSPDKVVVEDLAAVTLADFEAATTSRVVGSDLSFMLVVGLGQVVGPWGEVVATEDAAAARERQARQAAQRRAAHLLEAFAALGVTARADDARHPAGIVVSLDEADLLLELLAVN